MKIVIFKHRPGRSVDDRTIVQMKPQEKAQVISENGKGNTEVHMQEGVIHWWRVSRLTARLSLLASFLYKYHLCSSHSGVALPAKCDIGNRMM